MVAAAAAAAAAILLMKGVSMTCQVAKTTRVALKALTVQRAVCGTCYVLAGCEHNCTEAVSVCMQTLYHCPATLFTAVFPGGYVLCVKAPAMAATVYAPHCCCVRRSCNNAGKARLGNRRAC
jgi:hypothetical protein